MQSRGAGLMILVLDACRNNPLTAVETTQALADGRPISSLTRALPTTLMRGLTLPQIPTDVVGIYSAGFGQTALDNLPGDGPEQKNSVFVRVFAAKIKQPGLSLFEVMPDVQTEVADLAATAGKVTVAEVENLVEPGKINPDHIITPGIFVQRMIHVPNAVKYIEQRTVRKRA
jgi:hypothetical protein